MYLQKEESSIIVVTITYFLILDLCVPRFADERSSLKDEYKGEK